MLLAFPHRISSLADNQTWNPTSIFPCQSSRSIKSLPHSSLALPPLPELQRGGPRPLVTVVTLTKTTGVARNVGNVLRAHLPPLLTGDKTTKLSQAQARITQHPAPHAPPCAFACPITHSSVNHHPSPLSLSTSRVFTNQPPTLYWSSPYIFKHSIIQSIPPRHALLVSALPHILTCVSSSSVAERSIFCLACWHAGRRNAYYRTDQ